MHHGIVAFFLFFSGYWLRSYLALQVFGGLNTSPLHHPSPCSWAMASVLHNKLMKWRLKDGRRRKRFSIRRFLCLQDIWIYKLYSMGCNCAMNFPSAFFFEGERGIAIENLVFEPLASLARVFVPELQ